MIHRVGLIWVAVAVLCLACLLGCKPPSDQAGRNKVEAAQARGAEWQPMEDLNLPDDLQVFLREGKQPEYDLSKCRGGRVTLLPLDKLKCELFPTEPGSKRDPHTGKTGSYLVRGVNLVDTCENYEPAGLLMWLPLEKRYGTWDQTHATLYIFGPKVGWSGIIADFPRYFNAQWDPKASAPVTRLAAWVHHTYNDEQVSAPLPNLMEWYEAEWTRLGLFRNGVQERYPEQFRVRIERHGDKCEVTSQVKPAVKDAEWSLPERLSVSIDELRRLDPQLEQGFWNEPDKDRRGLIREPSANWILKGFKAGKYYSLARFYNESGVKGHVTHELGKKLAELSKARDFKFDH
jgi:hypothetical protein